MPGEPTGTSVPALGTDEPRRLLLVAEEATVGKRVRRTLVRAATTTTTREQVVEADLESIQVAVERVPIGRVVTEVPPVRVEGDVTILSVVEEEVVIIKRLVLKEEVWLTTVRSVSRHAETVSLREQEVSISRTPMPDLKKPHSLNQPK